MNWVFLYKIYPLPKNSFSTEDRKNRKLLHAAHYGTNELSDRMYDSVKSSKYTNTITYCIQIQIYNFHPYVYTFNTFKQNCVHC